MKHSLIFILIIFIATAAFPQNKKSTARFNETYRNQFHFSPDLNKMGSPIALWLSDSIYHLYYQYNPHNLIDGFMNWGHATSPDLISWEQQALAIEQPPLADSMFLSPWFGAVVNTENGLRAWLNRWENGLYQSTSDNGFQFNNEIQLIGTDKLAKSEPFVFWHKPTQKWIMIAYERPSTTMYILNSDDGLSWEETSQFHYNFGFPNLVEISVDHKNDDTRWVLFTEGGTCLIGNFDGKKFNIENAMAKFDKGRKIGGSLVYTNPINNKVIGITEIKSDQLADIASNGFMSFPYEITLHQTENGVELQQAPLSTIEQLFQKSQIWGQEKIYPGIKNNVLKRVKGNELYIKGTISIINSDLFGFILRSDRGQRGIEISCNLKQSVLSIMDSQITYKPQNKQFEFEILIDRSSLEVYIDGGKYVFRRSFSPVPNYNSYDLFTNGGEIVIEHLEVHQLKSIWTK